MLASSFWLPVLLGLGSVTSPCVFPLYPGFLAYLTGQSSGERRINPLWMGLLILAGVLATMFALGVLIATIRVPVARVALWITPLAYGIVILLGLLLLTGRNPFVTLAQIQVPVIDNPYINAFVYGMLYGPIALPCIAPQLVTLLALGVTVGDFASTLFYFVRFGFGFGLPLLGLALIGRAQQQRIVRFFTRHYHAANVVAGALLVGVGLWGFYQEWETLSLLLGA